MSDGPSIRDRRITKPWFPICSTCRSRSQARFCLYTLRLVSNQPERTFGSLRYILGGDRPSQTTRLTGSLTRIHGPRLELQNDESGISPVAPPKPKPWVRSLPPILRTTHRNSLPSCSKGSRGLSVLSRVAGIFTGITISQCPPLRQRPDRCAIRAGRNLPDKEFRYLRTVIVTAAVYRGFNSELRPKANPSS